MTIDYEKVRIGPAEWHRIKFVDGYSAKVVSKRPGKNQDGKDIWIMRLEPSEELVKTYKLQSSDTYLDKEFYYEDLITLSDDPAWTEHFCLKTWDNKSTPATSQFKGTAQIDEIKRLKEKIEALMAELAHTKEKLGIANTNAVKHFKQNFSSIMEEIGPALKGTILNEIAQQN